MYLHVVNTAVEISIRGRHVRIPPEGGVIGRSPDSMLCLPDNSCLISRRHALISSAGGVFRVTDLSSNGLILNDGHQPLGKGRSSPLHEGDLLIFPGYQVLVTRSADIPQGVRFVVPAGMKSSLVQGDFRAGAMKSGQFGQPVTKAAPAAPKHHSGVLASVLKTALGIGGGMQAQGFAGGGGSASETAAEHTVAVSQEGISLFNKSLARKQAVTSRQNNDAMGSDDAGGMRSLSPDSLKVSGESSEGDDDPESDSSSENPQEKLPLSTGSRRFDRLPNMPERYSTGTRLPAGFENVVDRGVAEGRARVRPDFVGPVSPLRGMGMAAAIQEGLAHIDHSGAEAPSMPQPQVPAPKGLSLPSSSPARAGTAGGLTDTANNALQASRNILLDARNPPADSGAGLAGFNPADTEAGKILARFLASQEAKDLLQPDMSPMDFNQALIDNQLPHDSMQFLAHAMTPRQAVWWGADCLDHTGAKWTPEEETLARAARAWSYSPSQRTLDGVAKALPAVPQDSPVAMLGQAALIAGSDPQFSMEGAEALAGTAGAGNAAGASGLSKLPVNSFMSMGNTGAQPGNIDGQPLAHLVSELSGSSGGSADSGAGSSGAKGLGGLPGLPGLGSAGVSADGGEGAAGNGVAQLEGAFAGTASAPGAAEGSGSGSGGTSSGLAGIAGGLGALAAIGGVMSHGHSGHDSSGSGSATSVSPDGGSANAGGAGVGGGLPGGLSLGSLGAFLSSVGDRGATTAQQQGASSPTAGSDTPDGPGSNGLVQSSGSFTGTASGTAASEGSGGNSTATDAGMSGSGGGGSSSGGSSSGVGATGRGAGAGASSGAFSNMMMHTMMGINAMNSMGQSGMGMMPYAGGFGGGFGGFGGGSMMPMPGMPASFTAGANAFDTAMMTPFNALGHGMDYVTNAMMTPFSAIGNGLDYATNAMMSPVETGYHAVTGALAAPMGAVAGALSGPATVCCQMAGFAVEGLATVAMMANTAMMLGAGAMAIYGTFSALGNATYSNYTAVTETYTTTVDDMSDITEGEDPGDVETVAI